MSLLSRECLVLPLAKGRIPSTVFSEEAIVYPERFSIRLRANKNYLKCRDLREGRSKPETEPAVKLASGIY